VLVGVLGGVTRSARRCEIVETSDPAEPPNVSLRTVDEKVNGIVAWLLGQVVTLRSVPEASIQ